MMIEQLHRGQAQLFCGALARWSAPAPDCLDAGESSRASVIIQSIKPEEENLDSVRPAESVAGAGMSGGSARKSAPAAFINLEVEDKEAGDVTRRALGHALKPTYDGRAIKAQAPGSLGFRGKGGSAVVTLFRDQTLVQGTSPQPRKRATLKR